MLEIEFHKYTHAPVGVSLAYGASSTTNLHFIFMQLGRALFNHLKVYKGPDHPHEAQKPIELPIRDKRIQKQK